MEAFLYDIFANYVIKELINKIVFLNCIIFTNNFNFKNESTIVDTYIIMACTNCSTKSTSSIPKGCGSHGTCGTDSCNKLNVFDWLSNMQYPSGFEAFDIVEVRFKNGRKDFYKNIERLPLLIGDVVATEANPGHDVGTVTLTGELVRVQMNKKKVDPKGEFLKIYRKATQKDIDLWQEVRAKEEPIKVRARELAIELKLE